MPLVNALLLSVDFFHFTEIWQKNKKIIFLAPTPANIKVTLIFKVACPARTLIIIC
jgi:hypothetical protein